jgi:hypothetical protein
MWAWVRLIRSPHSLTLTGFVYVAQLLASGGLHSRRERFPIEAKGHGETFP